MKYMSKILCPQITAPIGAKSNPGELTTKSQRLLSELGFVRSTTKGCHAILPFGHRIVTKLEQLIDDCMASVGAQRLSLPALTPSALWNQSGRLEEIGHELFQFKDRQMKNFVLNPTHEESITSLVASLSPISYKSLPLRLYQITTKYRDEMRPRFGLLRAREFSMCDMYSFDETPDRAETTYNEVGKAYDALLKKMSLPYCKASADGASMGGRLSHEYLVKTQFGESHVLTCHECGYSEAADNPEGGLPDDADTSLSCTKCLNKNPHKMSRNVGIEVGHTFLLGDRYSSLLKATAKTIKSDESLQMGCYGIGVSRLMAAAAEALSTEDQLRWPKVIAPYSICIIGPKDGSIEIRACGHLVEKLHNDLLEAMPELKNDIIIDDRLQWTIGKRQKIIARVGVPFTLAIGKHTASNNHNFELIDNYQGISRVLGFQDIIHVLKDQTALSSYEANESIAKRVGN